MHPVFREIGALGCRCSRELVLAQLEGRNHRPQEDVWEARSFHCRQLAIGVYLLTNPLIQNRIHKTRRSTIWLPTVLGSQILFQRGGTIVEGG